MIYRRLFLLTGALLLWSVLAYGQLSDDPTSAHPRTGLARSLGQSSLYFIENHGQVAGPARYYLQGRDRTLFVADDGITVVLKPNASINHRVSTHFSESATAAFAMRLEFVGSRTNASLRGEGTKRPVINLVTS